MQRLLSNPKIKGLLPAPDERRVEIREHFSQGAHVTEMKMADGSWQVISVFWCYEIPPTVFYSSKGWNPWE